MSALRSVAVVIPSWNSLGLLPRCLDSLREQGVEIELLVVDNGSSDGSVAYLEREGVPCVSLPRNIGFAAAMNLGAARVRAGAILCLNADTVLEPGCAGGCWTPSRRTRGWAACSRASCSWRSDPGRRWTRPPPASTAPARR